MWQWVAIGSGHPVLHVLDVFCTHKFVCVVLQILGVSEGEGTLSLTAQTPAEASEQ